MTTTEHRSLTIHRDRSASAWTAALEIYRKRRAVRALHQRVEQELSTYTTQADIHELDAMLERSGIEEDSVYTQMIQRVRLRAS